jgi:hypothetical protein
MKTLVTSAGGMLALAPLLVLVPTVMPVVALLIVIPVVAVLLP